MIPNKEELIETAHELRYIENSKKKIQDALYRIVYTNRTSRSIIFLEDDLSLEGSRESGRIQGRLEAAKIILEELGCKIEEFKF